MAEKVTINEEDITKRTFAGSPLSPLPGQFIHMRYCGALSMVLLELNDSKTGLYWVLQLTVFFLFPDRDSKGELKGFWLDLLIETCTRGQKKCVWIADRYDNCWTGDQFYEYPGVGRLKMHDDTGLYNCNYL